MGLRTRVMLWNLEGKATPTTPRVRSDYLYLRMAMETGMVNGKGIRKGILALTLPTTINILSFLIAQTASPQTTKLFICLESTNITVRKVVWLGLSLPTTHQKTTTHEFQYL